MNTHPTTHRTYLKYHSVTIHISQKVHGMGGGESLEGSLVWSVDEGMDGWRVHGVGGDGVGG